MLRPQHEGGHQDSQAEAPSLDRAPQEGGIPLNPPTSACCIHLVVRCLLCHSLFGGSPCFWFHDDEPSDFVCHILIHALIPALLSLAVPLHVAQSLCENVHCIRQNNGLSRAEGVVSPLNSCARYSSGRSENFPSCGCCVSSSSLFSRACCFWWKRKLLWLKVNFICRIKMAGMPFFGLWAPTVVCREIRKTGVEPALSHPAFRLYDPMTVSFKGRAVDSWLRQTTGVESLCLILFCACLIKAMLMKDQAVDSRAI